MNLTSLVDSYQTQGVYLSALLQAYKQRFKSAVQYEKLGFGNFEDFVFQKLDGHVKLRSSSDGKTEVKLYGKHVILKDDPPANSLIQTKSDQTRYKITY